MNKICKRCEEEKPTIEFGDNKNNKDGKSIYCKICELERGREYREKNREKVNNSAKNYRKNNPEKYKEVIEKYLEKNPNMTSTERSKKYRENEEWREKIKESGRRSYLKNIDKQKEKSKKYCIENKEKIKKSRKEWNNKNKEKVKKINYKSQEKRRKTDGFYRMKKNLRSRIRKFLINETNSKRTKEIVGLDKMDLKLYIQSKFLDGMSWENYGKWHLDHIRPLSSAKNDEEVIKLNHYTNLQPLWAEDNIKKGNKL
jgi:hypothetical protein